MHTSLAFFALAASSVVSAIPQGVTATIAPPAPIPAGCSKDYSGTFQVTTFNVTSPKKRDLGAIEKRQAGILTLTLADGTLKDAYKRTGYIASNYQFQFDGPPQAGALYTAGWSVCGNGSLALGGSAIFYQCYSGGFYNLYDRSWAAQCSPIYIEVMGGQAVASQKPDGQPQASTAVSQKTDGQPLATTVPVVSQLSDGQPQASQGGSAQPSVLASPITQISDGQPQAPTAKPVPVSENSDGQPQATSPAPAPKATGAPVSQISDGQPQATGSPVSQASDGQPQASAGATSTSKPSTSAQAFTGAAGSVKASFCGLLAGVVGAVALL